MKLTRSKLKDIVKECIVEVLAEGIGDSAKPLVEAKNERSNSRENRKTPRRRNTATDNIRFDKRVNEAVSSMTQDPTMAAIFADTAKTTLQDQIGSEGRAPIAPIGSDSAARAAAQYNREDLFEGSSNWAMLAFDEDSKK